MLKCQVSLDVEYNALQGRIERADSLVEVLTKKFEIECRQSEIRGGDNLKSSALPFAQPIQPKVLQNGWNLPGLLESAQLIGEGLVQIRIEGKEWLVSDEISDAYRIGGQAC
jgi:hypothetical protein